MRNLIILFSFLSFSLIALTLYVGVPNVKPKPVLILAHPHMYGNENISIKKINITVFYFIPKDALAKKQDTWKEITEQHLKNLSAFHALSFNNTSKISYQFFPEPIIGEKTSADYESLFEHGDHDALMPVKDEITKRVFAPKGDLHTVLPENKESDERKVYLIVFEGNGAAGNDDFCLISRSYLTDPLYIDDGSTFLAHEFYHTLGLPDNYETSMYVYKDNAQIPISLLTKKDIMGQVNIPLPYTYIDTATLKKMGL